jgi:hypothetical protein
MGRWQLTRDKKTKGKASDGGDSTTEEKGDVGIRLSVVRLQKGRGERKGGSGAIGD